MILDMKALNNKTIQASLLVAISGILYGFLGYMGTKIIDENLSIPMMLFWRFLVAGLWMSLFFAKKQLKNKKLARADKRTLCYTFLFGAIGYSGSCGFFFMASQYTGTGVAMVIFFSYPIAVALCNCFLHKEAMKIGTGISLLAITLGLFLLRDSTNHPISLVGILLGVLAALSYAFYVIGSKRFSSLNVDSTLLTMVVCFSCAFIFCLLAVADHSFVVPHSLRTWGYILGLGIFVTALPIQLMLEGLKHISSMRASIISVLEPLVTVLVGILLLNESISSIQLLGVIILLGSTILIQFQKGL